MELASCGGWAEYGPGSEDHFTGFVETIGNSGWALHKCSGLPEPGARLTGVAATTAIRYKQPAEQRVSRRLALAPQFTTDRCPLRRPGREPAHRCLASCPGHAGQGVVAHEQQPQGPCRAPDSGIEDPPAAS